MSKYHIEKDAPLPEQPYAPRMPFEELEVGDRFAVDIPGEINEPAMRQRIWRFEQQNPPIKLSLYRQRDDRGEPIPGKMWLQRMPDKTPGGVVGFGKVNDPR